MAGEGSATADGAELVDRAGETSRSLPYQVDSPAGLHPLDRKARHIARPLWQAFEEWLPEKPYCGNDLRHGLVIRSRAHALSFDLIQLNHPLTQRLVAFDIDRPAGGLAWEEARLPPPNIIVGNASNGHAHLIYALRDPVHAAPQSRSAPLRYLADIERGMIRRLDADPSYSGFIAKNPRSPSWRTQWTAAAPYALEELNRHLTATDKRRESAEDDLIGLGRNCILFHKLRQVAYRAILAFKRTDRSPVRFQERLVRIAGRINQEFALTPVGPLSAAEVSSVVKSVLRFCWRHFSAERFSEIQRMRASIRTVRHLETIRVIQDGST